MLEATGRVIRAAGNSAWIQTARQSSCGSCSARSACGTGSLSGFFAARQHEVKALNPIGAQPGEEVIVGIHESVLVWGSAWLYLFPLLSLLAGSLLAKSAAGFFALNGGELPVILGGLAGMLAGFFGLHAYQTYRSAKGTDQTRQQAVILRRMANADVLHFIPGKSQVN